MKTSNHTPGPWHVAPTYQGKLSERFQGFPFSIDSEQGFQPALIFGDGEKNAGTAEANARLIASAPDLLAALEGLQGFLDLYPHQHSVDICGYETAALQAIAKAKGETK